MKERIRDFLEKRKVTRFCHFVPFRNFHHILPGKSILCSSRIEVEDPSSYNPTDKMRLDGKKDYICLSVEYPNVWYLNKLERAADVYPNHAILLIDTSIAEIPETLFSARNAAAFDACHSPGIEGLCGLFAQTVKGQIVYDRSSNHPIWLPTDMQAEVLVPDSIPLSLIRGVLVKSHNAAANLIAQVDAAKSELTCPVYVSPECFDRGVLSKLRTGGKRPYEELYIS